MRDKENTSKGSRPRFYHCGPIGTNIFTHIPENTNSFQSRNYSCLDLEHIMYCIIIHQLAAFDSVCNWPE